MRRILRTRTIEESGVGRQPRSIHLRIEALDESYFFGGLIREIIPLVIGVMLDTECSTLSVGIDETDRYEVVLGVQVTPV